MTDAIRSEATKELKRIKQIMEKLEIADSVKSVSLVKVMNSYYEDCLSFYKKGQYLQALETAYIVWAQVDSGLHLGVFKVPDSMKSMFTI